MRDRVEEALALVELEGYEGDRFATQLSGGQQQRLALARAIVCRPGAAALGRTALEPRRAVCKRHDAHRTARAAALRLGITTLYVTHDQTGGAQHEQPHRGDGERRDRPGGDAPRTLRRAVERVLVAEFLGVSNSIPCTVTEIGSECAVETSFGRVRVTEFGAGIERRRDRCRRGFARSICVSTAAAALPTALPLASSSISFFGEQSECARRSKRHGAARARAVGYGVRGRRRRGGSKVCHNRRAD